MVLRGVVGAGMTPDDPSRGLATIVEEILATDPDWIDETVREYVAGLEPVFVREWCGAFGGGMTESCVRP